MKPRLLDLFCGAGGAAKGYQLAGFRVTGVDINPQPNYCGDSFVQGDALEWVAAWDTVHAFDAIHASPPCQGYTTMNNRHGSDILKLIGETRELLQAEGLPWVIENVPGALSVMKSPVTLSGAQFGLGVHRPRLFEASFMLMVPPRAKRLPDAAAIYGKQDGRRLSTRADGTELRVSDLKTGSEAMGIDWMTWDELREAIPPAYAQFIGRQLLQHLGATHA